MSYAWRITKDHLAEEFGSESEVGITGPRSAPKELLEALEAGKGLEFKMYDDDGILYYTGKAIADKDDQESEDFCYGPLGDFGSPNAGAVLIKWTNHPEWNCG